MITRRALASIVMGMTVALSLIACGGGGGGGPISETTTPIKHVIVIIGENHSFDNVFATYVPSDPSQQVWNLLSQGIIDAAGKPGPKFSLALQQQAIDTSEYELSPARTTPFATLPQPSTTLNALPAPPCELTAILFGKPLCSDIGLEPTAQKLLDTGGTGQALYFPSLGLFSGARLQVSVQPFQRAVLIDRRVGTERLRHAHRGCSGPDSIHRQHRRPGPSILPDVAAE